VRRLIALIALVVLCALALPSLAAAAPVSYTMQTGSQTTKDAISLEGDQLRAFHTAVRPETCPDGQDPTGSHSFDINFTGPVQLTDGKFQFSGHGPPSYYPSDDPAQGADYTITGSVTPDTHVITGTIAIDNATDPFITGCSARYDFLAIPAVEQPAYHAPDKNAFTSQFVSFDYQAGVIRNLRVQANFNCGNSSDAATVYGSPYGFAAIHTDSSGRWRIHSFVFDEYGSILDFEMNGRLVGNKATGHIIVKQPAGLQFVSKDVCKGNYAWSAARPVPPAPPGPQAFFDWNAVRVASGTFYRYYFLASSIKCTNGANAIRFKVAGRQRTVSCRARQAWASAPLTPGREYLMTAAAVKMKHGHVVKRGTSLTESLHMPDAGDLWLLVDGLPGSPPR
jgi:hypothetical protein